MKKLFFVILAAVAVINAGSFSAAAENESSAKVIAYYFHGSFRCVTCTNMERYAREAVESNFKGEYASGKIEFKAINVEEKGNEHFAKEYRLYTRALVLSLVRDGREVKSKNLDKMWQFAGSKQKFIDYVSAEINGFLKEPQ